MKIFLAVLMLLVNFFKCAFLSGLDTAKIILFKHDCMISGLAEISYGELNENTASLLGALITLTPGTSLINIDTQSGVLVLHLLDLERKDETLKSIQQDFYEYLKTINEVMI